MMSGQDLYIDLLKRSLKNIPYIDVEANPIMPRGRVRTVALGTFERLGVGLVHARRSNLAARLDGTDHTSVAHTMISMGGLDNVQMCVESVLADNVPGDLIETGVLRGGTTIFMAGLLKAYDVQDRNVWVADSFEGLPRPDPEKYPADAGAKWHEFLGGAVSLEEVRDRFDRYGLLNERIRFLKGWFKDTLSEAPIGTLSIIRLDGDMYESTMDALVPLYPKLSAGGYLIVDDYQLRECRQAIEDYRESHSITDEIVDIDGSGAFWRKSTGSAIS